MDSSENHAFDAWHTGVISKVMMLFRLGCRSATSSRWDLRSQKLKIGFVRELLEAHDSVDDSSATCADEDANPASQAHLSYLQGQPVKVV